jgi:nucleotide-binding universal stress UspA family protein
MTVTAATIWRSLAGILVPHDSGIEEVHMTFKKVLIAVDASPIAAHAADVGMELARSLGAALGFIHIVDPSEAYVLESGVPTVALIAVAEENGKKLLEGFQQRAGDGTTPPLALSAMGKPAHEIVRAANDWRADLIVVGSHGRGGMKRMVLGSVAEGVTRHAACPVLVVRAPE